LARNRDVNLVNEDRTPRPETPRSEPEIIPPGHTRERTQGGRVWISIDRGNGKRTYVKQPGPFTVVMVVVGVILVVALVVMLVLGALLIWVPIAAVIAVGAIMVASLKGYFRRRT
jgi:hypothetical protein